MTTEEAFVEQKRKNLALVWLMFGLIGGHRIYLKKYTSAVALALLLPFGIGILWWLSDGLRIYKNTLYPNLLKQEPNRFDILIQMISGGIIIGFIRKLALGLIYSLPAFLTVSLWMAFLGFPLATSVLAQTISIIVTSLFFMPAIGLWKVLAIPKLRSLIVLLCLATSLYMFMQNKSSSVRHFEQPVEVQVLSTISVRSEPSSESEEVAQIESGQYLTVQSLQNGWALVDSTDNPDLKGWVNKNHQMVKVGTRTSRFSIIFASLSAAVLLVIGLLSPVVEFITGDKIKYSKIDRRFKTGYKENVMPVRIPMNLNSAFGVSSLLIIISMILSTYVYIQLFVI